MKSTIVADGHSRLRGCEEFQSRLLGLKEAIERHHADELAEAGFLRRILIHRQITREFKRQCAAIEPSPGSLFNS